ncbi:MAG: 50S ribosomal protein L2 [Flavobacteriales bacterium]
MAVKKLKPVTPGHRFTVLSAFDKVTTDQPEKKLTELRRKKGGRNQQGKMTMRMIGGGHKQLYRKIDFKRDKTDVPGTVKSIEYDPNRSALIALIHYADGEKRYIIAPEGLEIGATVKAGSDVPAEVGNALPLKDIPLGTVIHNVELKPGQGAEMVRGAGAHAQLLAKEGRYAVVKLPSGESRMVLVNGMATIGSVSHSDHILRSYGKAGRSRYLGRRPRQRAVSKNPIDHPMGGGEGKASGGHPRNKRGLSAKGFKTRKKKKHSNKYIIERRKK